MSSLPLKLGGIYVKLQAAAPTNKNPAKPTYWGYVGIPARRLSPKSSQVNTPPIAKSQTRSKQNKGMHRFSSVYSERGVLLPVLTSGGE
jgi:hypothetical protein